MTIKLTLAPKGWYKNKHISKIQQSEIAFTNEYINTISSSGAGPCVILIVVDRISKQGFMTHLFSAAEISPYSISGQWLIKHCLEKYQNGLIDCYMIGGYRFISYLLIKSIEHFIDALNTKLSIQHIHKHINHDWVSNIVFDFTNNELFMYESYRDKSPLRKLDTFQGFMTSYTNLLPCCRLIEYQEPVVKKNL